MTSTPATDGFPKSLLRAETSRKVEYFERYLVRHPNLDAVDRALWRGINHKPGPSLFFVIGPTGVGKTTLMTSLQRRLEQQAFPNGPDKNDRPPYLACEIAAPESSYHNWRDFYLNLLEPLETKFIQDRLGDKATRFNLVGRGSYNPRGTLSDYRETLIDWFKQASPPTVFIDETQHLVNLKSGRLVEHLDVLKSFASRAKTKMVLFGTYQLLPGRNLSAQLSRRSVDLHFSRYGLSTRDARAFESVIWAFQRHLPLRAGERLVDHVDLLYSRSVGCVGILKNWLTWALENAWEDNSGRLTLPLLKASAPSLKVSSRIAEEVVEGEQILAEGPETEARLFRLLGLTPTETPAAEVSTPAVTIRQQVKKVSAQPDPDLKVFKVVTRKPRLPQPVGARNPKRDPVGKN